MATNLVLYESHGPDPCEDQLSGERFSRNTVREGVGVRDGRFTDVLQEHVGVGTGWGEGEGGGGEREKIRTCTVLKSLAQNQNKARIQP